MAAVFTNLSDYLAIAEEALAESTRLFKAGRTPKPDGQPGYIITWDPARKSFKQSLIAIAFAGIYFEALIYIEGVRLIGKSKYKKIAKATYEVKLRALGMSDESLIKDCKRFRKSRNDLVHEKAVDITSSKAKLRFAQVEAQHAFDFILRVTQRFSPNKPLQPIARKTRSG